MAVSCRRFRWWDRGFAPAWGRSLSCERPKYAEYTTYLSLYMSLHESDCAFMYTQQRREGTQVISCLFGPGERQNYGGRLELSQCAMSLQCLRMEASQARRRCCWKIQIRCCVQNAQGGYQWIYVSFSLHSSRSLRCAMPIKAMPIKAMPMSMLQPL